MVIRWAIACTTIAAVRWFNPGTGNQDSWFFGWLLQRQVTDRLALGGEVFHQPADTDGGKDTTSFNVGAIYDLAEHYCVLFSAGRGLQNATETNEFSYYVAVRWTF